jgi:hypothetical protein
MVLLEVIKLPLIIASLVAFSTRRSQFREEGFDEMRWSRREILVGVNGRLCSALVFIEGYRYGTVRAPSRSFFSLPFAWIELLVCRGPCSVDPTGDVQREEGQ